MINIEQAILELADSLWKLEAEMYRFSSLYGAKQSAKVKLLNS